MVNKVRWVRFWCSSARGGGELQKFEKVSLVGKTNKEAEEDAGLKEFALNWAHDMFPAAEHILYGYHVYPAKLPAKIREILIKGRKSHRLYLLREVKETNLIIKELEAMK